MAITAVEQVVDIPPLRLDLKAGRLWNGELPIELRPKPWELILYMAGKPGELLSKQELMDAVWPESFVSESSLNQAIKDLRKALGDDARSPRFIETVHRRGFRLLTAEDRLASADIDQADSSIPLFGRSSELETLQETLRTSDNGQMQLVFLTGEPGIGKTSLVRRFLDEISPKDDCLVGYGNCYDLRGESEAYLPFLEGIDRLARGSHGELVQELLGRHAPSWHAQFPWMLKSGHSVEANLLATSPSRMLREFCDFIERLSESKLVVFWLEDLHWSDIGTIDLLEAVAARTSGLRLMVVASYRPVDAAVSGAPVAQLKRSLVVRGHASELSLEFLEPGAVEQLVTSRLDSTELPGELCPLLHDQTSGNPLFVTATLNHLLAGGLLEREDGRWMLKAPIGVIQKSCPDSLRHIVELQRSSVSDEEAEALDAASTVGELVDTQAVAGALGVDSLHAESVLDGLAKREQFLRRAGTANWPDGSACQRFEFIHAVYREVTYQSLTPGRRQELHRRIAECLAAGFSGAEETVAAELATHAELGGDRARAIRFLRLAARKTESLKSPADTLSYLERAHGLIADMPADIERDQQELDVILRLTPSLIGAEGYTCARLAGYIEQAIVLSKRLGDRESHLRALNTKIALSTVPGDWQSMAPHVNELQAASEAVSDPKLKAQAGYTSAWIDLATGHFQRAHKGLTAVVDSLKDEELREPARLLGHDPVVSSLSGIAFTEWLLGRADQAESTARRCRLRAEAVGAPQSLATGWHTSMTTALFRGENEQAEYFQDMLDQCLERNEVEYLYMRPLGARTQLLTIQGRPEEAIRVAQEGLEKARENQAIAYSSASLAALAEAQLAVGQLDDGLNSIEQALAHSDATGERVWRPETLRIKGQLLSARNETGADEECFRAALLEAAEMSALSFELRAAIDLAKVLCEGDRLSEAHEILKGVLARFTEGFETADYLAAQSLLSSNKLPAAM
jgi:DNA-binding winged helix-turn-helix (wHTH) protein/tetratricopeptide (TPR) repeat protein